MTKTEYIAIDKKTNNMKCNLLDENSTKNNTKTRNNFTKHQIGKYGKSFICEIVEMNIYVTGWEFYIDSQLSTMKLDDCEYVLCMHTSISMLEAFSISLPIPSRFSGQIVTNKFIIIVLRLLLSLLARNKYFVLSKTRYMLVYGIRLGLHHRVEERNPR